jgi:uncharacterized membrane protein
MNKESNSQSSTGNQRNYFGAVFLIIVGVVFLFNTTGLLPWGFWGVFWSFWPLLLIFGGLFIILGHSRIASIILTGLVLAFFLFLLIFAALIHNSNSFKDFVEDNLPWVDQLVDAEKVEASFKIHAEDYEGVEDRIVTIEHNAGELDFKDEDIEEYLTLDAKYYEGVGEPNLESSMDGDTLEVDFDTESESIFTWIDIFGQTEPRHFDFILGQKDIETNLRFQINAGEAKIDLDEVSLSQLVTELNAGDVGINLGVASIPNKIKVRVNAGDLTISLSQDTGLDVSYEINAGSLQIDGDKFDGLSKEGGIRTEDFSDAENQVEFEIEINAGSVEVKT